jgi:hypothetical protein
MPDAGAAGDAAARDARATDGLGAGPAGGTGGGSDPGVGGAPGAGGASGGVPGSAGGGRGGASGTTMPPVRQTPDAADDDDQDAFTDAPHAASGCSCNAGNARNTDTRGAYLVFTLLLSALITVAVRRRR